MDEHNKHARERGYWLRATQRCLVEDLDRVREDVERAIEGLDDDICRSFVEQRSQNPDGQEYIQGIDGLSQGCSLHVREHRGLTWHDEENHVVWLLAARFHRSGKSDDAYPYFRDLGSKGRLLPTEQDYEILFGLQEYAFSEALITEPQRMIAEARANHGREVRGRVGGTVRVSVLVDDFDGSEIQYLAISQQFFDDGGVEPPQEWIPLLLAAFFDWLDDPADQLSTEQALPGRQRESDELIFAAIR